MPCRSTYSVESAATTVLDPDREIVASVVLARSTASRVPSLVTVPARVYTKPATYCWNWWKPLAVSTYGRSSPAGSLDTVPSAPRSYRRPSARTMSVVRVVPRRTRVRSASRSTHTSVRERVPSTTTDRWKSRVASARRWLARIRPTAGVPSAVWGSATAGGPAVGTGAGVTVAPSIPVSLPKTPLQPASRTRTSTRIRRTSGGSVRGGK